MRGTTLDVRILAAADPGPLFPEVGSTVAMLEAAGTMEAVGIIENATDGGRTGVALLIKMPDGKLVIGYTTATLFLMAAGAVQGAKQRFGDVEGN